MKIVVYGLGHVGTVSAACLAQQGHEVVGVDPSAPTVQNLNGGLGTFREPGLNQLIAQGVAAGRLRATASGDGLVAWADVSLICVGTPSGPAGSPSLAHVREVAEHIGRGLGRCARYHVVVLRSTVPPGTTRRILIPLLESSSRAAHGADFGVVMNPDFTRETSAVDDFLAPAYTVIGQVDDRSGAAVAALYQQIPAPIVRVGLEEAEMLKLASNAFHAVKVGFANEIGRLCDGLGIDGWSVMDLLGADTRLNASSAYLEPGFAFGGSCLPKDLRSLTYQAHALGTNLPILEAVTASNALHIESARRRVRGLGVQRVAVLGLGFKRRSDDVRESPAIVLVQGLVRDGMDVTAYDPALSPDDTLNGRRSALERDFPEVRERLCPSIHEALKERQAVVVTQQRSAFSAAVQELPPGIAVVDLVRRRRSALMPPPSAAVGCAGE